MSHFRSVSNDRLLTETRTLVADERRIGLEILHRLREISRRRLHLELGYSSLFTFCVQELKYSEGAAYRRLNAMKLLEELPEVEQKIQAGTLSLATVSQVQGFCKAQKMEPEKKQEILAAVECKSKRETERFLADLAPSPVLQERERAISSEQTEIRLVVGGALFRKLKRIQDLKAHQLKDSSYATLLEYMADRVLERIDPELKRTGELSPGEVKAPKEKSGGSVTRSQRAHTKEVPAHEKMALPRVNTHPNQARYVPVAVRRAVWQRDQGRCAYVDQGTGRRCAETRYLQLDHRIPKARGGRETCENLRLACASHNAFLAIQAFGQARMSQFIRLWPASNEAKPSPKCKEKVSRTGS